MTAFYHTDDGKPAKEYSVLVENPDGTLELGVGKTLVIGKCKITREPIAGSCTVTLSPVEEVKPKKSK